MRPESIIMFERLFLGSLALSIITFILGYDAMMDQLTREPGMEELGFGSGFVIGSMVVGIAINLLLWFLVAHKASNVAKWILVVLMALSLLSLLASMVAAFTLDLQTAASLTAYALNVTAVAYLFRDDAKAWLKGQWNTDPTTFD